MKRVLVMLFAVALAFNSNAQEVSATYDPDVDGDNNIGVDDLLSLLSLFGENDLDDDGIWDSQDDCVLDICGVCGGEGIDLDEDGICDDFDECVGEFDECGVCNGNGPEVLVIDTITFTTDSIFIEALNDWYVFEIPDTAFTFVCTNPGCIDPMAENFDPFASDDDGSCIGGDPCANELAVTFDGYTYDLVAIGDQCWFAENLRTEHYTNGDSIPANLPNDSWQWLTTTSGAVTVYGENTDCNHSSPDGNACDPTWSLNEYGRLYNWYAVDDERGLCPMGWHVPTDEEWTVLVDYLGGTGVAGSHMKSAYGWYDGGNGNNSSGFRGLPGGVRDSLGYFTNAGLWGLWWSSTSTSVMETYYLVPSADVGGTSPKYGVSVRCLRDD